MSAAPYQRRPLSGAARSTAAEDSLDGVPYRALRFVDVVNHAQLQALRIGLVFLARHVALGFFQQFHRLVEAIAPH